MIFTRLVKHKEHISAIIGRHAHVQTRKLSAVNAGDSVWLMNWPLPSSAGTSSTTTHASYSYNIKQQSLTSCASKHWLDNAENTGNDDAGKCC